METNGSWATNNKIIVEKLKFLSDAGMDQLKISCDPFHAEFIDIENVKRLAQTATELLGAGRVLVRWEKYLQHPVRMRNISEKTRRENYISAMRDYPCRFTGRAAGHLAEIAEKKIFEPIETTDCLKSFLGAKGIHVDPYGNVFSGLCSGIILGNVNQTGLDTLWRQFDPQKEGFISRLCKYGPGGFLDETVELGYEKKNAYAGKCHICTELRKFFFDNGMYKSIIGPCDCYSRTSEVVLEK